MPCRNASDGAADTVDTRNRLVVDRFQRRSAGRNLPVMHDDKLIGEFGSEIEIMLSTEQTDGAISLGLAVVPAGTGPPTHTHANEDEYFYAVECDAQIDPAG